MRFFLGYMAAQQQLFGGFVIVSVRKYAGTGGIGFWIVSLEPDIFKSFREFLTAANMTSPSLIAIFSNEVHSTPVSVKAFSEIGKSC